MLVNSVRIRRHTTTGKERSKASLARRSIAVVLTACALAPLGCAQQAPLPYRSQLDEFTGVTINAVHDPMVFYKENLRVAVNAREYIHVGPIRVNQMGNKKYYLWLGRWSTIDENSDRGDEVVDDWTLRVTADRHAMVFPVLSHSRASVGAEAELYPKPAASAEEAYYAVSPDQLRRIAEAEALTIALGEPMSADTYVVWHDGGDSFRTFVETIIDGERW